MLKYELICFIAHLENLTQEIISLSLFIISLLIMFYIAFPFFLLERKEDFKPQRYFFYHKRHKTKMLNCQKLYHFKKHKGEKKRKVKTNKFSGIV